MVIKPAFIAMILLAAQPLRAEIPLEDGIRSHLGKLTTGNLPGLAVLLARDGKIIYQGGFGWADLEKKTPVSVTTKFRIGSVSKQFTAAAILRLQEDGKLALADPLEKFFPGFPPGVTLRQLLTHTSGIRSFTDKPDFMTTVSQPVSPAAHLASFRADPPDFPPGEGFHYNNSGYFLLGEIVAKVSGKPFANYLQDAFFRPLGMNDSGVYENANPPPGMAKGYSIVEEKPVPALDWDMSRAGGAGALYSTLGDLFLWNEALFGGKILKQPAFKAMTTQEKLPANIDGMDYGFGLVVAEFEGLPAITHSGGLDGWSSDLLRLPEQRCTVIALANALPPAPGCEPSAVTRQIAGKFLQPEIARLPLPTEDPAVDRSSYPDYAGRYDYKNAILTVNVENGRLFGQLTGQEKYEIFPSKRDAFFWKITAAKVVFQRDAHGKVIAARHAQGGNSFTAPRLAVAEILLTDAELDATLGRYQYGPAAVLTVTRDGPAVFAQLTGQPKFPLHPKSATDYEWRVVEASVTFKKDAIGKITHATHRQNGATFDAPKIE